MKSVIEKKHFNYRVSEFDARGMPSRQPRDVTPHQLKDYIESLGEKDRIDIYGVTKKDLKALSE